MGQSSSQLNSNKMHENHHRRKKITSSNMLRKVAKQFCLNTALHGYKFIVLPKRMLLERIIWVSICLTSLVAAVTLLCIAWFGFQQNPTILLTDSNHHAIWNYEFPAVTVCDYNKISMKKAYELARNLAGEDQIEHVASHLKLLIELTKLTRKDVPTRNFTYLQNLLDEKGLSVDTSIKMLAYTCDEMLERCLWKGEEQRCDSVFEQVKTSDGFCCAFNYFALRNNSFRGIMARKSPKHPRRVSACGYQTGLEVLINNRPHDYFASYTPSVGQKIIIHNPYYYPDWSSQAIFNPQKTINSISLNPTKTYCSGEIRHMAVEMRNCLFPNERKLMYFRGYNFRNCMVECRMNMTKKLCKCYPYQYIQNDVELDTFCSLRDIPCLQRNHEAIASCLPGAESADLYGFDYNNFKYYKNPCGCLPDCETTEYVAESSTGNLVRDFSSNQPALYGGIKIRNHSVFRVFFNDLVGIRIRRGVKFNWHTLLAYYGGLLGLFLGFSFVSGIEIIYFFSIRLISEAARKNKKKKNTTKNIQIQRMKDLPLFYQELDAAKLLVRKDAGIKRREHFNSVFYLE